MPDRLFSATSNSILKWSWKINILSAKIFYPMDLCSFPPGHEARQSFHRVCISKSRFPSFTFFFFLCSYDWKEIVDQLSLVAEQILKKLKDWKYIWSFHNRLLMMWRCSGLPRHGFLLLHAFVISTPSCFCVSIFYLLFRFHVSSFSKSNFIRLEDWAIFFFSYKYCNSQFVRQNCNSDVYWNEVKPFKKNSVYLW